MTKKIVGRFAAMIGAIALVTLLAACGGGGGGGAPTPVTPTPATDSITITGSVPASGTTNVATSQTLEVSYTSSPGLQAATASAACVVNGIGTSTVAVTAVTSGSKVVFSPSTAMPNGATCTFVATLTAGSASASGTVVFTTKPLSYTEAIFAIDGSIGSYPVRVMPNVGTVTVVNQSQYQVGPGAAIPLRSCSLPQDNQVLPSGHVEVICLVTALSGATRSFAINPVTNVLTDYTGPHTAGATWHSAFYGTFGDTPYAGQGISNKGMYVTGSYGVCYMTDTNRLDIKCTASATPAPGVDRPTTSNILGFSLISSFTP